MKKMKFVLVMLALAGASTAEAMRFGVKDWEVACDNTRRCEAVGYQTDESGSAPVALWLGRDAGAGAALEAKLSVVTPDDKDAGPLTIVVGKLTLAGLKADTALTSEQIARLMPQLLDAETAKVSDGKGHWLLSLAGLKAALLKMDEQQGRVGTTTALAKPGTRAASTVPPPLPAPTVRALAMPPAQKGDERLLAAIAKTIPVGDCSVDFRSEEAAYNSGAYRLPGGKVLLVLECDRAAYQSSFSVWIAGDKPPYAARRLTLPGMEGGDVMNASFENGKLNSYAKGRGVFDCGAAWDWVWTAQGFQLVDMAESNLCRGMPGGFMLREWTATVVK